MFTEIEPDPGLVPYCTVPSDAITLPAVALPVTVNDVSVPNDVMLGCAKVVSVPAILSALNVFVAWS